MGDKRGGVYLTLLYDRKFLLLYRYKHLFIYNKMFTFAVKYNKNTYLRK